MHWNARWSLAAAMVGTAALSLSVEVSARSPVVEPIQRPALITPKASHASLLGLARAGDRLVGVGERGVVLVSDDHGQQWRQVAVPVSVTLTVVRFADAKKGWAAGHNGVLLKTADAGATWEKVIDGRDVAKLYQAQAKSLADRLGKDSAAAQEAEKQARQLLADGPDKPWLDMAVDPAGGLWLVGAYGLVLRSADGVQWEAWSAHLDNPKALHLYAVRVEGDRVLMAGEQALLLQSTNRGQDFSRLTVPYKGSLFDVQASDDDIVTSGLRGNVLRSADGGRSFQAVPWPLPISITTSLRMRDGSLLLADQSGAVHQLRNGQVTRLAATAGPNPAALTLAADGRVVSASGAGPLRMPAPADK